MLYQKKGDTVLAGSKMFTVGGEVFANHTCDYGGLFGTVTEIRTGPDQCTERDEPDICCDLQPPESETMVMEIKDRTQVCFLPIDKFEFCDICQPFLIGTICRKFSVQYVFRGNTRF